MKVLAEGFDGSARALLLARRTERAALLARITRHLENDRRLAAAWLFGSLGRGDEDDLSDLDVFVAVADADFAAVESEQETFAAAAGGLLAIGEAPQNTPPGGAYLSAVYDAPTGPHLVDWYWQPSSRAQVPTPSCLLFDRIGLPRAAGQVTWDYQPVPPHTEREAQARRRYFFWMMLLITAKYAARSPREETMGLLTYFAPPEVWTRPQATPSEKFALLRYLADKDDVLAPFALRFLDLCAQTRL